VSLPDSSRPIAHPISESGIAITATMTANDKFEMRMARTANSATLSFVLKRRTDHSEGDSTGRSLTSTKIRSMSEVKEIQL
jgi:hypothetical protein